MGLGDLLRKKRSIGSLAHEKAILEEKEQEQQKREQLKQEVKELKKKQRQRKLGYRIAKAAGSGFVSGSKKVVLGMGKTMKTMQEQEQKKQARQPKQQNDMGMGISLSVPIIEPAKKGKKKKNQEFRWF